jgi:hypothetical protein
MSDHYPRLCEYKKNGHVKFRVGLSFAFYMFHPHTEVARGVMRALETYVGAVGPQALTYYADDEGEPQALNEAEWDRVRREMLEYPAVAELLFDAGAECYRFKYSGTSWGQSPTIRRKGKVCEASFWLPTEFLEARGPARVRELALAMAATLPFSSGHAGLSFNGDPWMGTKEAVREFCFRFPGVDISGELVGREQLGTHIYGVHWLTFLGQPALGALGGVEGLRAQLHSPGTTVQELEGARAVITLGEWPEAGDTERGDTLPAYRELARVLEPWLYFEEDYGDSAFPEKHQWERRFLD